MMLLNFAGTLPVAATDVAMKWDSLYIFLVWLSVFFFILVVGGMLYFSYKYRASERPKPKYIHGHVPLEIVWTIVPTILLLVIFAWGYVVYKAQITAPTDAMEVRVIAKQWLWQFQYEDGRSTIGELFVPVNKPVKLIMTSTDVLHSLFIPNFRIKQDVVPGMYTTVWFETSVPGRHQIFCTEYCGTAHSGMLAEAKVLTPEQWTQWMNDVKPGPMEYIGIQSSMAKVDAADMKKEGSFAGGTLADQGKELLSSKGCIACHQDGGTSKLAPMLKGIYGTEEEMVDGSKVKVDDNYIRESIENPNAKVIKGYNPIMPSFKGILKAEEINAIISYTKGGK